MRAVHLLVVVTASGIMSGCGQKGPLVLPDAQRPHKKIVLTKPSPAPVPAASAGTAPTDAEQSPSASAPSTAPQP
jgi:predicted small lipoprotein YifL